MERKPSSPTRLATDALTGDRSHLGFLIDAKFVKPGFVEIDGRDLIWNHDKKDRTVRPDVGLLSAFLRLHTTPTSQVPNMVLAFAQKYGVLTECAEDHALDAGNKLTGDSTSEEPASRTPPARLNLAVNDLANQTAADQTSADQKPQVQRPGKENVAQPKLSTCFLSHSRGHFEPLEMWLTYSRQAAAILRIWYCVSLQGRPGKADDWRLLNYHPAREKCGLNLHRDRELLLERINTFSLVLDLRPKLTWRNDQYAIDFQVESAGTAIAAQMMLVIARNGGAICAGCQEFFTPKRLPPTGQNVYCGKRECELMRWRATSRRRYQSKKAGRKP